MCDTANDDDLMRSELNNRYGTSSKALFNMLQDLMPYQQPEPHIQVNTIVRKGLEEPGHVTVLTLVGPSKSGKSLTCHTLNWALIFGNDQIIAINTSLLSDEDTYHDLMGYEHRSPTLSLAQRLTDATVTDPSIILLIIDDVHIAPSCFISNLKSLLEDGILHTDNDAYFTLSSKTTLFVVFTCLEDTELTSLMGHIIPYQSPRYGNQ